MVVVPRLKSFKILILSGLNSFDRLLQGKKITNIERFSFARYKYLEKM